jgi:hypothetical protein
MGIHFTWDVSAGQIVLFAPLGGILWWLWKISSTLRTFMVEHEMLMASEAEKRGVKVEDFPTRSARKNW